MTVTANQILITRTNVLDVLMNRNMHCYLCQLDKLLVTHINSLKPYVPFSKHF